MYRKILAFLTILFATASFALAGTVAQTGTPEINSASCTLITGSDCSGTLSSVSPVRVQISVSPNNYVTAVCTGSLLTNPPSSVTVCKSSFGSVCMVTSPVGAEKPLSVGNWHEVISPDGHFSLVCEGVGTSS